MTGTKRVVVFVIVRGIIALVIAAVAAGVAYTVSSGQPSRYSTSARYVVSPGESLLTGDQRDLVNSLAVLDTPTLIATYAEVMSSGRIAVEAGETVGLPAGEIADYEISATELAGASIVEVTVTGPDPGVVTDLTNAAGERSGVLMRRLFRAYEIEPIDAASEPRSPSSPDPTRDALVAGLLAGSVSGLILLQIGSPSRRRREAADEQSDGSDGRREPDKRERNGRTARRGR